MRRQLVSVLVASATAVAVALMACGGQQQATTTTEGTSTQEQTTEGVPATDDAEKDATDAEQTTEVTDQGVQISEDDAKRIALEDAGVSEKDATRLTVHLDADDGVTKYEVEFNVGQTEYEYDIDPATGSILEHSMEVGG